MRRAILAMLLCAAVVTGDGLKATHRRNLMAESVYQFSRLAIALHDTVGCDAVKAQLLDIKAVCDTTVAAADSVTRAAWKTEIDSVIAVVDSVRAERKLHPIEQPLEVLK